MLEQARAETVAAASREASERAQREAAIEARVTADANRRLELELARRVRGSMSAISRSRCFAAIYVTFTNSKTESYAHARRRVALRVGRPIAGSRAGLFERSM